MSAIAISVRARASCDGNEPQRADLRGFMRPFMLGLTIVLLTSGIAVGGVLSQSDFKKIERIKPLFQNLMVDLAQSSKRTDLPAGDVECVQSTLREMLQISDELSSYEYLITLEKDMNDFGPDSPMREVVKFAIEKSNTILASERKRLAQLSDQCARFPLSYAKTQQALQFIDTTADILKSVQSGL